MYDSITYYKKTTQKSQNPASWMKILEANSI